MRTIFLGLAAASLTFAMVGTSFAASVSEREYKRGYADCLKGAYDQNQHGASYKRGCRAAEQSGKTTGHTIRSSANPAEMKLVCRGAVVGRFHPHVRSVNVTNTQHQDFGWGMYGTAVMDDGSFSDFVCMFSSGGVFKRVNASDPVGASNELDHEGYCPADVSEADRYKYPGCN
jgi:hypothetical protein